MSQGQAAAPVLNTPAVSPAPTPTEPAQRPAQPPVVAPPAPIPAPLPLPPPPAPSPEVTSPAPVPAEPRAPAASASASSLEKVTNFLRDYNGGSCFFVTPLSILPGEATIEAFGATPAPFMAFDAEFQRTLGFEPQINLRQITLQQCPLADFMTRQAGQRGGRPPKLTLRSDRVRSGQELGGTAEARPEVQTEIFLLADDGLVYSLANYSRRTADAVTFSMRIEATGPDAKPQIVLALTSAKPLTVLKSAGPTQAGRFFQQLTEEAARSGAVGVSTRYFKLGG